MDKLCIVVTRDHSDFLDIELKGQFSALYFNRYVPYKIVSSVLMLRTIFQTPPPPPTPHAYYGLGGNKSHICLQY